MDKPMLEIKDLRVLFPVHKKWLPAVDGVSLSIHPGEITGVVGESGSGKSVMSQSILRLRDHDTAVRYEGEILLRMKIYWINHWTRCVKSVETVFQSSFRIR